MTESEPTLGAKKVNYFSLLSMDWDDQHRRLDELNSDTLERFFSSLASLNDSFISIQYKSKVGFLKKTKMWEKQASLSTNSAEELWDFTRSRLYDSGVTYVGCSQKILPKLLQLKDAYLLESSVSFSFSELNSCFLENGIKEFTPIISLDKGFMLGIHHDGDKIEVITQLNLDEIFNQFAPA